jgi:hypothetical protein
MLFREHSHEEPALLAKGPSDGKSVVDGKSGKSLSETIPETKSKLSDQGLYLFSLQSFCLLAEIQQYIAILFSYRSRL